MCRRRHWPANRISGPETESGSGSSSSSTEEWAEREKRERKRGTVREEECSGSGKMGWKKGMRDDRRDRGGGNEEDNSFSNLARG